MSQADVLELLNRPDWQMRAGERAALQGLLSVLRPRTAIELGTHRGGSLSAIAAHSEQVHSFDLTLQVDESAFPNVSFHVGDSHTLLAAVLADLHGSGTVVDFALADGDHSPDGVRRDVIDLLSSRAVTGVIVMHDAGNEAVRHGLLEVPFERYPAVAAVDLDFVPALAPSGPLADTWGGFGMIVLDPARTGPGARPSVSAADGGVWAAVREGRRVARRQAGVALRRAGLHPSQLRAHK